MTIFWRIFLGFWLATAILLAIVFSAAEPWPVYYERSAVTRSEPSALVLHDTVNVYESKGADAFLATVSRTPGMGRSVILFQENGSIVAPPDVRTSPWKTLATQVMGSKEPEIERVGTRVGVAIPLDGDSGKRYVIVLTAVKPLHRRFHRPQFWTKLTIAMIPATLICWGLAIFITRPLSTLRATARRLAGGDLSARPPEAQTRRSDEVGQLSRDIDLMACRIEELLNAQRRFVANVSHELGAPLTRMQLAVTLLQREVSSQTPEGLLQIEREADRLSHLVQELLFLASLEKRTVVAEKFRPVPLASLCREIVCDNAAEAEEKTCTVSGSFEEIDINGAPQALRRAIENVFRNAIRHSSPGSEIRFSCSATRFPGFATVEVSDFGPGVPEHMLAKIFEPFVRIETQQSEGHGAGLGLAIAFEAVALHEGAIWASNKSRGGLIVTMKLPRSFHRSDTSR